MGEGERLREKEREKIKKKESYGDMDTGSDREVAGMKQRLRETKNKEADVVVLFYKRG